MSPALIAFLTGSKTDFDLKDIIIKRRLIETPKTLEELSQEYSVSRERVRQIETRAFEKLQEAMKIKAKELKLIVANED